MSFSSPLGLLAALAIPVVLALHLFRRRLRQRRVAGLFLFAPDALAAEAGRQRARLMRTASLWLELAAALLLALWLGGLAFGAAAQPDHLVVVLDDTASMAARGPDGSAAERGAEVVRAAAAELPGDALVTLIESGARPRLALGPRAPIGQLDAALRRWQPGRPGHDLGPALDLGRELGGTHLLLVTDHPGASAPAGYRRRAVGAALPNAAVMGARRVPGADPDEEKVFVDVIAFGARAVPAELTVTAAAADGAEGVVVARKTLSLEPGRASHLSLSLPRSDAALAVALGEDALALDNEVVLLPAPRKPVHVADLLPAEQSAALRLPRMLAALPGVEAVTDPARAELVLAPAPGALRAGTTEIVVAAPGEERDDWIGPFLIERRHPLLAGVTLEGVVWGAGRQALPGVPLVLAGNQPLLSEETRGDATRLHLDLDPARTNLQVSPDWPILLANVVEETRARLPGPRAVNLRVGEPIEYRPPGPPEAALELALEDPGGRLWPARSLGVLSWETRVPGRHRLLAGEREVARFAVHFVDPGESDLTGLGQADQPAQPPPSDQAARGGAADAAPARAELTVLALLLLAAVVADWLVLGRSS